MKKIIFLSVIFTVLFAMQIKAQIYNMTGSDGNIFANSCDYVSNGTRTWNINTGVNKPVIIECNMDIMTGVDFFYIYSIDNNGKETLIESLTGLVGGVYGGNYIPHIKSTGLPTGKAKVVLISNEGYCDDPCGCMGYYGVESYYWVDNSYTATDINNSAACNAVLGCNAGVNIANGTVNNINATNSVFIGKDTKAQTYGQTNQIVIGYNAIGNGSNTVTIGNDQITKTVLKGTVSAKEIQIENPVLPDYVFSPDYNLMPLGEIENYIKQNNHLPNIPSAAETANKGMSIGEMQNLLLQKIEELTLYIIQQNKKIQELEEKLKDKE